MIDRRQLLYGVASLLAFARSRDALAGDVRKILEEASHLGERLSGTAWQDEIERSLIGIDVRSLAAAIDMEKLLSSAPRVEKGARVVPVNQRVKLFAFEPGRANPPHAHDKMVSIHLVLKGRFRVRHFERVRDERDLIAVRPAIDRVLGPSEATSISDARNNVHWHLALEESVLLDVLSVTKETRTYLIDPERAKREGDLLLAPRIESVDEALKKYG